MRGGAVFKKPEIMTVPWKDGEKAVKMRWDYHEKMSCEVRWKRWKTIVTVRHCGDGNGDGNHDGDGDGESSVTVGVNYGENGEKRWNDFHRSFTVVRTYGQSTSITVFTALSPTSKRWKNIHSRCELRWNWWNYRETTVKLPWNPVTVGVNYRGKIPWENDHGRNNGKNAIQNHTIRYQDTIKVKKKQY